MSALKLLSEADERLAARIDQVADAIDGIGSATAAAQARLELSLAAARMRLAAALNAVDALVGETVAAIDRLAGDELLALPAVEPPAAEIAAREAEEGRDDIAVPEAERSEPVAEDAWRAAPAPAIAPCRTPGCGDLTPADKALCSDCESAGCEYCGGLPEGTCPVCKLDDGGASDKARAELRGVAASVKAPHGRNGKRRKK